MSIVKFRNLVSSYLKFVLKDINDKEIFCYEDYNSVKIVVKFKSKTNTHGIQLYVDYTENIELFDSEMLSIANQIEEMINYERNNYDR